MARGMAAGRAQRAAARQPAPAGPPTGSAGPVDPAAGPSVGPDATTPALPVPREETESARPAGRRRAVAPERPQPVTPDMIPDLPEAPVAEDDASPLSAAEQADRAACQRVFDHYGEASWMFGAALEVMHFSRLYRDDYPNWGAYVEADHGISKTASHQAMREWRTAQAMCKILHTPPPQSHIRSMLPISQSHHGISGAVDLYVLLRSAAEAQGVRLTADHLNRAVAAVLSLGPATEPAGLRTAALAPITGDDQDEDDQDEDDSRAPAQPDPLKALRGALTALQQAYKGLAPAAVRAAAEADAEAARNLLDNIRKETQQVLRRADAARLP